MYKAIVTPYQTSGGWRVKVNLDGLQGKTNITRSRAELAVADAQEMVKAIAELNGVDPNQFKIVLGR